MRKRIGFKQKHVARPPDGEPWVWHTAELLASRVWQTRSRNCIRLIDRVELEHMAHAGKENGRLGVGYGQFVQFGIGRRFITATIAEAEERGLIVVESHGWKLKNVPNRYRLTYYATARKTERGAYEWHEPTNEWKTCEKRFLSAPLNKKKSKKLPEGELSEAALPNKVAENLGSEAPPDMQKGEPSTISRSLLPYRRSRSTAHASPGIHASQQQSQPESISPDRTKTGTLKNSGGDSRRKIGLAAADQPTVTAPDQQPVADPSSTTPRQPEETTEPMLFDNLPDAPNEVARVRAAYVGMIAVAPRSTHGRIAACLGVSSQHLSHWKAGRYPLNPAALRTLRGIIDGSIELPLLNEDDHAAA